MSDKVYLIDGSGYIFRAYYAVAPLSNSEGFPTNALFGFVRMVMRLIEDTDSDKIVMVFDAGRETFRNELYAEYKANRDECPEDLKKQMPYFREFSRALGLPVFEQQGFEADDIIGTLCERIKSSGNETVIVSGDKDLLQLVGDGVTVWDPMREKRFGPKEVLEKMGVAPEKVVELLGLMGDSSDNIPGVKGVGPKTAVQLIELCGNVAQVIESTDLIRETKGIRGRLKIADTIEENKELIRLSRQLVEVKTDVKIMLGDEGQSLTTLADGEFLEPLTIKDADFEKLAALSSRFEFHSLYKEFEQSIVREAVDYEKIYKTVTKDNFESFIVELKKQKQVAIDLEASSLDVLKAEIIGFAFCWSSEQAWYLPLGHVDSQEIQVVRDLAYTQLRDWLADDSVKLLGQNLKYDLELLLRAGFEVKGVYADTMLASYLLNPDKNSHSLSTLASEILGRRLIEFDDVVAEGKDFSSVPIDKATHYAAEDAHIAWLLFEQLKPQLVESDSWSVFTDIEVPLVEVLARMELLGIRLDCKFLQGMSKELEAQLLQSEKKIYELAGEEFNPNSPKQLSKILFEKLGIPTRGVKKTKTGFSTDSSVLEKLSAQHELPQQILDHRVLHKLKSTYVDALPAVVSPITDRLHTRFNQTVTATGRLSSSDPNLQNIPMQREEGRKVRKAFVADKGKVLISADYSQIELRLLADMSGDPVMQKAFQDGVDIHSQTARELLDIEPDQEVPADLRRIGKTINFGIVYGMSGFRLARELGISVAEAQRYIDDYFARYSAVRDFFDGLEDQAEKKGFVSTLFGRRRYLTTINSQGRDRGFLKRVAINAPIQGSAADIIKLAMINIDRTIQDKNLPVRMLLQIHDELLFECDSDALEESSEFVCAQMEGVVSLSVPLKVEVGSGINWYEAH